MIRIPYFIQLSTEVIEDLFKLDIEYPQKFPHGFIDDKALLPSDFNELGIERFKNDLIRFNYIQPSILKSIEIKISKLGVDMVLPTSLRYLI